MQLSTYLLPYGAKEVREYIETRGENRLPLNVSEAADEAYMAEKGIRLNRDPYGLAGRNVLPLFRHDSQHSVSKQVRAWRVLFSGVSRPDT
jgi:hypothetical protein